MAELDNRVERLTPAMPRRVVIGARLIPAMLALAAADLGIAMEPGIIILDDHAFQVNGRADLSCNDGNTLTDGYEVISDVVAYWNDTTAVGQIIVVDGDAATSGNAEAPTDAEIVAALPSDQFPWIRLGRVKFSRSGSAITLESIDHGVRPFEIETAPKAAGLASSSHETDVVGEDAELYEYAGEMAWSVDAADIANGDLVTTCPLPLFFGKIGRVRAVCEKAVSTGAKAATINLEVGTTNLTGGVIALSGTYALGAVVAGTAITGGGSFKPGDTVSVEASGVTAFTEGRFRFVAELYRLRT